VDTNHYIIMWDVLPNDPTEILDPNMSGMERDEAVRDYVTEFAESELRHQSSFVADLVNAALQEADWTALSDDLWERMEVDCTLCRRTFPLADLVEVRHVGWLCPDCLNETNDS